MDFPADLISAETRIADDLATVDIDATKLAITGRTKNIAKLARFGDLSSLWIAGLGPVQLKAITRLTRLERLTIHDMRITNLKPLATMTSLKALCICGNAKAESLAGIDLLGHLEMLVVENFAKLSEINPIAALTSLRFLCIEGSMYRAMTIDSLGPLAKLINLEELRLANLRVIDRSLRPVTSLMRLRRLFIANMFALEEFARLSASLTETEGNALNAYWQTSIPCDSCEERKVLLTGEGQPALCPSCDAAQVKAHIERFHELKQAAMDVLKQ